MSFEIYVGNYPQTFSISDVNDLFKNFNGVSVRKLFKKNQKCFSFLECQSIDQVVSVVREMNSKVICGRNLIVRASETKLQNYIDLLIQDTANNDNSEVCPEIPFVPLQVLRNKSLYRRKREENAQESLKSSSSNNDEYSLSESTLNKSLYRSKREEIHNQSAENAQESLQSFSPNNDEHSLSESTLNKSLYRRKEKENHNQNEENAQEFLKSFSSNNDEHSLSESTLNKAQNVSSRYSYSSECCMKKDIFQDQTQYCWVSVTNFPLYTSWKSLFHLFSDYNPIKVNMVCNTPKLSRVLTEAHVCFENEDIVNDVILTFDNTLFNGRVILVNDIEDLSILNELLDVSHAKRN